MKITTYNVEAEVEETHWWFVGRGKLLKSLIDKMHIPLDAPILDLGTSTGSNLRLLRDLGFSNYQGLDSSDEAIQWCAEKNLGSVQKGDVCNIPFESDQFRLVLATDIIEHVDEDLLALSEIHRVLSQNGVAIITVPAFQMLWGLQDQVAHHKRRYLINSLKCRLELAGLICQEIFYFNYVLFLPILLARQIVKILPIKTLHSENQINTPLLNRVLTTIFLVDVWLARRIKTPLGVSILAVVRPSKK
jgi:SAM-dependent methyltransferase